MRPKPAASLIVIDRSGDEPRFLMGKRHDSHAFMPGKYVFPGGKTDRADYRTGTSSELQSADAARLGYGFGSRSATNFAKALGLSAIREAFEESGVIIGSHCERTRQWPAFGDYGLSPDLSALRYVARAITPPGYPRRYDTRFFAVFRDKVALELPHQSYGSELSDHAYVSVVETGGLDLPGITRTILEAVTQRLSVDPELGMDQPVPVFLTRRGKFICEFV
jgi:8-oxo-dGTP pyrophosphatase MutT (NUDIX family)